MTVLRDAMLLVVSCVGLLFLLALIANYLYFCRHQRFINALKKRGISQSLLNRVSQKLHDDPK
jgi:hypothetical protein